MTEAFPEGSPFHDMEIASHAPLRGLQERQVCEGCQKRIKYFCYRCIRLAPDLPAQDVPSVSLPLHLAMYMPIMPVFIQLTTAL